MSDRVLYFAYGSNLHPPQMQSRCPDCEVLQPAVLADHHLAFRGHSTRWGGGPATILAQPGGQVHGLLYSLTSADLALLDGFESYPKIYNRLQVSVVARDGSQLDAITYMKRDGEPSPPSLRYFHQIWLGHKTFALDESPLLRAVEETLASDTVTGIVRVG
ncbi:MAG TPA: gamma-glutamylcyclotransferase family protein [bacterium]|nr:gamma-glutamylcyclotransferase family protein [bacterium]